MRGWRTTMVAAALVCAEAGYTRPADAQTSNLKAFASDKALTHFFVERAARQKRLRQAKQAPLPPLAVPSPALPAPPPPPPAPEMESASPVVSASENIVVTGAKASITNTQEADVDEGGIVKVHGKHLVVLRRGRLFTVAVGDPTMRAIDYTNAFPPSATGEDAWYDEMLISGDRVIVVGFSYERGGTEINRFRIDSDGRLHFEDSHHLRSSDYYSASNYASRLIGNTLIFYTPLQINTNEPILPQLPALQRWTGENSDFKRIVSATSIYLPAPIRRNPDASIDTLHTVTTCDLATARLQCEATGVLGSGSRNFYVSGSAVYVWISEAFGGDDQAMVYRLPLDGSQPGAAQAWGGPVDQFSFREDRGRDVLNVLVRAEGGGERMWRSEVSEGEAALLTLPLSVFGDGSAKARPRAYRPLPLNRDPNWSFHNRFVGKYLVYSAGEFVGETGIKTVFVAPLDGGAIAQISSPHAVDRIDIMGTDAVVIGNDARKRLGFTAIELVGQPKLGDTSFLAAAREGERRSQAFFYRPDAGSPDGASGTLGLPVTRDLGETPASRFLGSGSAIAFLRRDARSFRPAGDLAARAENARDDACQASCTDWYGNARPIFLGDRIFALMGYELVEGRLQSGKVDEVARLDFAPPSQARRP